MFENISMSHISVPVSYIFGQWSPMALINAYDACTVVKNCVFENNTGVSAILAYNARVEVQNTSFLRNLGPTGTALNVDCTHLEVYNSTFDGNEVYSIALTPLLTEWQASGSGGAISLQSQNLCPAGSSVWFIQGSTFRNNSVRVRNSLRMT